MRFRFLFILCVAVSAQAAPMYKVVRIAGPTTIVVLRNGVQSEVQLTGIEITDRQNAIACLTWSVGNSWVMVEDGRVYRSPDAMLVNEELVRKGYARDTSGLGPRVPASYLGELDPEPLVRKPERAARRARPSPAPQRFAPRRPTRTSRVPRPK